MKLATRECKGSRAVPFVSSLLVLGLSVAPVPLAFFERERRRQAVGGAARQRRRRAFGTDVPEEYHDDPHGAVQEDRPSSA